MKTLEKLDFPIIQGGMGIGISLGGLAGAVAREGGMGVISTANIGFREPDFWENPREADKRALEKEIKKARSIAGGKGLLAINAMVATTGFGELVRKAVSCGIDAVISGAGLPLELPELTKGSDVLIAPVVSSGRAAKMLKKIWEKRHGRRPDFFVVEGSQAGGHLGFEQEEVEQGNAKPLLTILKEVVKEAEDIPVFAAGSVFDSKDIRKCLDAGARGVQIATRFIATEECDASEGFKDVILSAKEEDVTILKSPVGMPGRGLKTPLIQKVKDGLRFGPERCIRCIHTCEPKTTLYCINNALIQAFYGNKEEGLFFCGGNVGRVNSMTTVKALMEELTSEWRK
ncbi:MAG: NAD(P)H-dependent flavin oxidoreductase [Anaerovoracaceae bacterium]